MASKDPMTRAAIIRNAQAAERERLRNVARARYGHHLTGDDLEQRVDQLEREKLSAAGKKGGAATRQRLAEARRLQALHAALIEHTQDLLILLRSVGADPDTCDHDWPGELDTDAACTRCGLPYADWSETAEVAA